MSPEPNARDAAGRTLTLGLVLLTLPTALLVLGGVGVFIGAASSDSDAGGFAVLFALQLLVPAVLTSPFPILGWSLLGPVVAGAMTFCGARSLTMLNRASG